MNFTTSLVLLLALCILIPLVFVWLRRYGNSRITERPIRERWQSPPFDALQGKQFTLLRYAQAGSAIRDLYSLTSEKDEELATISVSASGRTSTVDSMGDQFSLTLKGHIWYNAFTLSDGNNAETTLSKNLRRAPVVLNGRTFLVERSLLGTCRITEDEQLVLLAHPPGIFAPVVDMAIHESLTGQELLILAVLASAHQGG